MTTTIIVCACFVLLSGFVFQVALNTRMRRFYDRQCMGREWRKRFPDVRKEEIRDFLKLFTASFALNTKQSLSFSPDDKVIDIYRAIYPNDLTPDALECETLVAECEARYGVDISKHFKEATTLGEIFYATHKKSA